VSHDFDVIGGTPAPTPPKIKPAPPPAPDPRRRPDDKMAAVPKEPARAK
jgi:hypothetical protein